mgnify:CR=1 FL=1
MRTLTKTQKMALKAWFDINYPNATGYCKFNLVDKMDADVYERIENIHPTEIHYQNCNNFLEELVNNK